MARSQRLRTQDLRGVFRLLSDLRELRHDRPALHGHLVETLCRELGATGGFAADIDGWRPDGTPRLRSFTPTVTGIEVVSRAIQMLAANGNLWDDPTFLHGIRRTGIVEAVPFHELIGGPRGLEPFPLFAQMKLDVGHVDHLIAWHQKSAPTPAGGPAGDITGISLHRYGRRERLFSRREVALARLLFDELNWLHATGRLAPPGPDVSTLPPRQRAVLDLLLAGHVPKEIAQRLGVTLHTVRDHIRRLYERYDADGQIALMAKFRRGVAGVA